MEVVMKHESVKKLTVLAMLCALAYVMVSLIRIPLLVPFLKYEPKDVILAIGGFLYGPAAALLSCVVVGFIEMVTISDTGWIGFAMNVLSSAAFACTAALVYRKRRTIAGAIVGLVLGVVLMVAVMLAWNYVLTPLYMDTTRADVAAMLIPLFLPFNLIKGSINAALTFLLYRPLVQGLRRARLLPERKNTQQKSNRFVLYAGALLLITACIVAALVLS